MIQLQLAYTLNEKKKKKRFETDKKSVHALRMTRQINHAFYNERQFVF